MPPMKLVNIRVPKEDDERIGDIARSNKKTKAFLYREAISEYVSKYSNRPSLNAMWDQLQRLKFRVDNLERTK